MIVYPDSLDCYGSTAGAIEAGWSFADNYVSVDTSRGRFGGSSFWVRWNGKARHAFSTSGNEVGIQAAFRHSSLASADDGERMLYLKNNNGADQIISLSILTNGAIRLRDANNAIIATSDPGKVIEDKYQYLEIWVVIDNSGSVIIKIDGKTIINVEDADTSLGSTDADWIDLRAASKSSSQGIDWDDIIILDGSGAQCNELLGDSRIYPRKTNADTSQQDWSLSEGSSSYALLDDPVPDDHDGDGTYIYDNVPGHKTRCGVEDITTAYKIHAAVLVTSKKKTDAGARTSRGYINSNGVEANGATQNLSTDYLTFRDIFELDPDGDVEWTALKVSNIEIGAEVVS